MVYSVIMSEVIILFTILNTPPQYILTLFLAKALGNWVGGKYIKPTVDLSNAGPHDQCAKPLLPIPYPISTIKNYNFNSFLPLFIWIKVALSKL